MTAREQAIYLNAIPLLALGAAYVLVGATLAPGLWRQRRGIEPLELARALGFPCGGAAAIVFGALILRDPRPVGGNAWLALVAVALACVPAVAYFMRWRDRELLVTGARRARAAEAQ